MTVTTGQKVSGDVIPVAPARPRLLLQPDQSVLTLLDGGWWPRSADPATELPGLILALDEWHGRVTRIMLGSADWNAPRPRGLQVDGTAGRRVVRLGWFATMPAGLLTAFSANGQRTDLATIPAHTSEQDAVAAMERVGKPANRDHAPAILAVISAAASSMTGKEAGSIQPGSGEREGGQPHDHDHETVRDHSRPVPGGPSPRLPAVGARSS